MNTTPSLQEIEAGATKNGGYTRATIEGWGIKWPPKRGWLKKLKQQTGGRILTPLEVAGKMDQMVKMIPAKQTVLIEFDGGSSCNNPAKGFGVGYGSYRINEGPVIRWNEGRKMSANAGEIWTLRMAVKTVADLFCGEFAPAETSLLIRGDSQIALKWARAAKAVHPMRCTGSEEFEKSIAALWGVLKPFRSVRADWWKRDNSVRIFGH